jgi:hypothetical protein
MSRGRAGRVRVGYLTLNQACLVILVEVGRPDWI